jgi:hypothetical protein
MRREREMTNHLRCPVCASENVYCLLNTLHCKQCGNLWKEEKKKKDGFDPGGFAPPVNNKIWTTKKKTETLETRMEEKLNEYLKKSNGKFSLNKVPAKIGDISMAIFRRYIRICVKNRTLVEEKDRYGIIWYSRPK